MTVKLFDLVLNEKLRSDGLMTQFYYIMCDMCIMFRKQKFDL